MVNDLKETGGRTESKTEMGGDIAMHRGKENIKSEDEVSESCALTDRRPIRPLKEGVGRVKNKCKKNKDFNGEGIEESLSWMVRRKLSDGLSPFKAVAGDQPYLEP
ncbi:hypothetical protein GOBAR_DD04339 [Gossypium barbadense]|nr:hypothetical protein GOBAR_DD04339 [Gossypium barbadense]